MAKDWLSLQEEIRQLYHVENQTLDEVMRVIKGRHGFRACERSYRNQLRKWGYAKYSTASCPRPPGRQRNRKPIASAQARQLQLPSPPPCDPVASQSLHQHAREETDAIIELRGEILSHNVPKVQSLLHEGTPVNATDDCGNTPLYYAIKTRRVQMVQDLIRFGADVNATDQTLRSALHSLALADDNFELWRIRGIVDALVVAGADPSLQDAEGNTPLHLAVPVSVRTMENNQDWPILQTISDNETMIDVLLEHEPDLNLPNNQGISPFELLIRQRVSRASCKYISDFLHAGADISKPTSRGNSLLHDLLANSTGPFGVSHITHTAIVDFLQRGADPCTALPSREPIIRAILNPASNFHFEYAMTLLPVMMGLSTVWDDGNTIAHDLCLVAGNRIPADSKKEDICGLTDVILGLETGVDSRNEKGQTPLLLLLTPKQFPNLVFPIMTSLLEVGADPLTQDLFGESPLLGAAKWAPYEYVEALLQADLRSRSQPAGENRRQNVVDSPNNTGKERRLYWEDWELASAATDWFTARRIVFNPVHLLPEDMDENLRDTALVVLAKKHAGLVAAAVAEGGGSRSRRETLRKELSGIMRDYRTTGVEIPLPWVDMLLELS